jgi:aryl-alcohol dehydrogenase-like predicted oxidoreductase
MAGRLTRREAIGWLGGAVAAGAAVARTAVADGDSPPPALAKRAFGKTGHSSTIFGLGCFYVGGAPSDAAGAAIVKRAIDLGCNYLDVAPSYHNGVSERRVGLALEGLKERPFLSTKTLERDAAGAKRDLEASLKRLRVDRVDLLQVHCVTDEADLERVLSDAGPLPAILRAKERGLVRFVGVTGHRHPDVVRAAVQRFGWDSVLVPCNAADPHWKPFDGVLAAAAEKGMARVGMKVFGAGRLVAGKSALAAEECLRFAFGQDVSTAIVGCASIEEVETAARVAASFTPFTAEEKAALVARAAPMSGKTDDRAEWWKRG